MEKKIVVFSALRQASASAQHPVLQALSIAAIPWILPLEFMYSTCIRCVLARNESRKTDRQAGRQAGRQTGRQAGRQAGRQTGRQADKQAGRQAGGQAGPCPSPLAHNHPSPPLTC